MTQIERIQELVKQCNYHSNLYYTQDKPEITDKEYDQLYSELESLEQYTGYILSSSPTQKVQGAILPFLTKVKHTEPMLSAEKSKNINDVIKFMGDQECVLSWKLDGLTLVLRYNDGKLQQAITRGGGEEGEDVTHTVSVFDNVPLTIDYKGYLEIRGEGLVTFEDFERANIEQIAKGQDLYKSPRNLAAGSVRQLDATITKNRNLIFIAFGIVKCDKELKFKRLQFNFLQELGFSVVENILVTTNKFKEQVEWFKDKIVSLDYLTDGLIVEYNNIAYGKAQGSTGHHSKALYALKWQDDNCETTFKGVELNTTRTGMTSITGLFQEVDIDGINVSRASLHNVDIFEALQLGIGDIITVYRANQVIPQIEDNLTRSNTYKIDMHCPSCGSNLVIKQPKEARFLFCENDNCPSKLVDKFVHFCSKDAMNIDGLSEQTLEKFINKGFIKTFDDIYKLAQYKPEIVQMDGFGIKSYNKLIEAIEKSKNVKFESFIYSLGIDQIGKGSSKRLAKHFNNDIDKFLKATSYYSSFICIEDFGDTTTQAVIDYFLKQENRDQILELLNFITITKPEVKLNNTNKDLAGKTFVVTGSVTTYRNRNELEDLIISLNGKLAGSVSKNTTYLINNDITSTSGKNQKANELGVSIISEVEFNKMIGREV